MVGYSWIDQLKPIVRQWFAIGSCTSVEFPYNPPTTKEAYLYEPFFINTSRKLALLKQLENGFLDGKKMKILAEEQMQLTLMRLQKWLKL
jgi:hypothetical protein